MTFQRIFSIYALIILFFFASVTILLFTLFDNQSWRTIACFFLFPLLAALITLFIAALIFPSPTGRNSSRSAQSSNTQNNNNSQTANENNTSNKNSVSQTPNGKQNTSIAPQSTPQLSDINFTHKAVVTECSISHPAATAPTAIENPEGAEETETEERSHE